jgi:hypothetical protein
MGNWVYRQKWNGDNEVGYYVRPWRFVVVQDELSTVEARLLVHYLNGGS